MDIFPYSPPVGDGSIASPPGIAIVPSTEWTESLTEGAYETVYGPVPEFRWSELDDNLKLIDPDPNEPKLFSVRSKATGKPYRHYRVGETLFGYLPGDGDDFGWINFQSSPYHGRDKQHGMTSSASMHLLSGPTSVPLPPRLYDFTLGYQSRGSLTEKFSYDAAANVGVFSDFEDSARDGVRFPSHAVGMIHFSESMDVVFGVDYLHRDDIKILPVFGFSWHNPQRPEWRFDLVFPRPRVDYSLASDLKIYLRGLLGGGSWDIELPGEIDDVMTTRDFRMMFGIEQRDQDGDVRAIELGLVFSRQLELRSMPNALQFDDAFVIQFVSRH